MTVNRPYQLQESGPNSKIVLRLCLRVRAHSHEEVPQIIALCRIKDERIHLITQMYLHVIVHLYSQRDSDSNPNSDPIPVLGKFDGNLNPTPYSVKRSAYCNVAIWFAVQIGIGIWILQCK